MAQQHAPVPRSVAWLAAASCLGFATEGHVRDHVFTNGTWSGAASSDVANTQVHGEFDDRAGRRWLVGLPVLDVAVADHGEVEFVAVSQFFPTRVEDTEVLDAAAEGELEADAVDRDDELSGTGSVVARPDRCRSLCKPPVPFRATDRRG